MQQDKPSPREFIEKVILALPETPAEKEQRHRTLEADLNDPVRFIGIGQTGVRKTEFLRSIFSLGSADASVLANLKMGASRAMTRFLLL